MDDRRTRALRRYSRSLPCPCRFAFAVGVADGHRCFVSDLAPTCCRLCGTLVNPRQDAEHQAIAHETSLPCLRGTGCNGRNGTHGTFGLAAHRRRAADLRRKSWCLFASLPSPLDESEGELRLWLLQTQRDQLSRLSDDLQSYRQKRETLRRHAITPAEETAWAAAVEKLAGRWKALAPTESEVSCDG